MEMVNLVKEVLPEVETNMTEGQILRFGLKSLGCFDKSVLQQQIPAEDTFTNETIRGNAVLVPDLDENRSILRAFMYGTDPEVPSTDAEESALPPAVYTRPGGFCLFVSNQILRGS